MKVAWVTGGGTGIGKALAMELARDGFAVAISGRREMVLEQAARELAAVTSPGQIFACPCDVADPEQVQHAAQAVALRLGEVNLLVNNAGWNSLHPMEDAPLEEFLKAFAINCLGAVACAKAVLPAMQKRGEGAIVNISSVLGRWASADSLSYSVSKYAMAGFTDALQQELCHGPIRVLSVFPGFIQTEMTMPLVKPNSIRAKVGVTAKDMARAIMRALYRRKTELYYPWYVTWALRLHRWAPVWTDRIAQRVRGGERERVRLQIR